MSEHPIEHNPGDHEDPVAAETWTVTFVGVILFAVTVLFVAALSYSVMLGEREMKVIDAPMEGVIELEAVQSARLRPRRISRCRTIPPLQYSSKKPITHLGKLNNTLTAKKQDERQRLGRACRAPRIVLESFDVRKRKERFPERFLSRQH